MIETTLDGDKMFEALDGLRKSLDARDGRLLRNEHARHPQMLLAAHLRGDRRFRPIARRKVGDREFYIAEAVGDEFDRLRVHIDTGSNLIRVVESWERLGDETLAHHRRVERLPQRGRHPRPVPTPHDLERRAATV